MAATRADARADSCDGIGAEINDERVGVGEVDRELRVGAGGAHLQQVLRGAVDRLATHPHRDAEADARQIRARASREQILAASRGEVPIAVVVHSGRASS